MEGVEARSRSKEFTRSGDDQKSKDEINVKSTIIDKHQARSRPGPCIGQRFFKYPINQGRVSGSKEKDKGALFLKDIAQRRET